MDKNESYRKLIEMLQKNRKVDVNELAAYFSTSQMTIRRDLNALAEQYNIIRTHGGAMIGDQPVVRIVSFDEKRIAHRKEKNAIAAMGASLLRSGQRIYLDSGSTTRILLDYLDRDMKAVLVCNHLGVAKQALEFPNLSVIMLGGDMIRLSNCSSGPVAEEQIQKYSLDAAFIGAAAIGNDGNLFDGFSPEARFKSHIFKVASRVYLLADSTKINTYDLNQFGHLNHVDTVITDRGIDKEGEALMKRYNVNLIKV